MEETWGSSGDLHPQATLIAVEGGIEYARNLAGKADRICVANIERDRLPLADGEADLIIANQVLEHTKEIFWIFHEVSRSLKVGGYFLFGVPNVCSFHNRLLLFFGKQPTQHKLCSAHVRPFSKNDTLAFLNACFPEGYKLVKFRRLPILPTPSWTARAHTCQCSPYISFLDLLYDQEDKGIPKRVCYLSRTCSARN